MTDTTPEAVERLIDRLDPQAECGPVCPFCRRDPYHYVDVGVGMARAAVECCDLGIALFQYGDEQLTAEVDLRVTAAATLRAMLAEIARLKAALALLTDRSQGGKK